MPLKKLTTVEKGSLFVDVIKFHFEQQGYLVMKILSSKPFDLIGRKKGELIGVEVKFSGSVGRKQYETQLAIAKEHELIYYTAVRTPATGAIEIKMRYHPVMGEIS